MDAKIVRDVANPLLERRELTIECTYGSGATPSKQQVAEHIATMIHGQKELMHISVVQQRYGSRTLRAIVYVHARPEAKEVYGTIHKKVKKAGGASAGAAAQPAAGAGSAAGGGAGGKKEG